jgi:hypothetical protein
MCRFAGALLGAVGMILLNGAANAQINFAGPEPMPPDSDGREVKSDGDAALKIEGYLKAILIDSRTNGPATTPYVESLNRARLKLTYDVSPHIQVHLENDIEVTAGNYLNSPTSQQTLNGPAQQYWDLSSVLGDNGNYYATEHLYRAYLKVSEDAADLTLGRQRIPLGTGLIFSALDMLNPINPLLIERDEYVGVDAALLEFKSSALSKFSLVYAPDPARISDRWVGEYRTNINGTDLALVVGKYWGDHLVGMNFATQIGNAGVHGEITHTNPQIGDSYQKFLIGADYAFANMLTLSGELYFSTQSKQNMLAQFAQNPLMAQVEPISNRAAGISINYEFTPLLKTSTLVLFDLTDSGRVIYPTLSYSMTENMVLTAGVQFFSGNVGVASQVAPGKLMYGQVQYFF